MVHRDVKPENLFCHQAPSPEGAHAPASDRPIVKLLDFGISTPSEGAGLDAIAPPRRGVLGSPRYMSPEQLRTPAQVDHRADIWSLGVVLYELLAGRTPFEGQSIEKLLRAVDAGPPPSVCELRADVSPALDHVIARCLQADRELRFGSARELAIALADFASDQGRACVERLLVLQERSSLTGLEIGPPASLAPSEVPGPPSHPLSGRARRWRGVRTAMWIGAGASFAALAAALALFARPGTTATPRSGVGAAASSGGRPVAAAAAADSIAIPTVSVTDLPVAPPRWRPVGTPRTAASQGPAAASASAAVVCDPPYVVDETGITRFKVECFETK
jgi:serine/threonine-protein kinase